MQRSYHILGRSDSRSSRKLAAYLARHGQFLLPWVELIEQSRLAVDELIDVVGRAAIEAVLELSAAQVAGPRRQGRRRRGVGWYGRQRGRVRLKERKLAVHRPRLRRPGRGAGKEVPLPAYEAMQEGEGLGARMLDILLRGVSTRQYQRVLPEPERDQVRAAMRAAWRLDPKTGRAKLEKLAQWLERDCPAAAASLREGLEECFTINRLGLPASLHRCLATTNLIESPQAGVRLRTRRVCRWRDAAMVQRWVASSFLATEKNFRRLMGYQDLWMLKAILEGSKSATRREVA